MKYADLHFSEKLEKWHFAIVHCYFRKINWVDKGFFSLWVFFSRIKIQSRGLAEKIKPKPRQILEKLQHSTLIKKKKLTQKHTIK